MNRMNRDGDTPLCVAAEKGHDDLVELFLAQPAVKVNAGFKNFPLLAAVSHGAERIVNMLLKAGAEVNRVRVV